MPDFINVLTRWWKFILGLTVITGVLAVILVNIKTRQYLSTATALPVNALVNDRARIFNTNIQELYSEFGTADELDRLEGTAALDTLYLAAAQEASLIDHYKINAGSEGLFHAALELRKNSKISRSAYGELKFRVWDEDPATAALLANSLFQKLQGIHQQLQSQSNVLALQKLQADYNLKQQQFRNTFDTVVPAAGPEAQILQTKRNALLDQISGYEKMMDQYQIAINTNSPVLFLVEPARASLWPDKPKKLQTILFALGAAFVFSFLISIFVDSRKTTA